MVNFLPSLTIEWANEATKRTKCSSHWPDESCTHTENTAETDFSSNLYFSLSLSSALPFHSILSRVFGTHSDVYTRELW